MYVREYKKRCIVTKFCQIDCVLIICIYILHYVSRRKLFWNHHSNICGFVSVVSLGSPLTNVHVMGPKKETSSVGCTLCELVTTKLYEILGNNKTEVRTYLMWLLGIESWLFEVTYVRYLCWILTAQGYLLFSCSSCCPSYYHFSISFLSPKPENVRLNLFATSLDHADSHHMIWLFSIFCSFDCSKCSNTSICKATIKTTYTYRIEAFF